MSAPIMIKIKQVIQNTKTNQQGEVKFMKWIHLYGSHNWEKNLTFLLKQNDNYVNNHTDANKYQYN